MAGTGTEFMKPLLVSVSVLRSEEERSEVCWGLEWSPGLRGIRAGVPEVVLPPSGACEPSRSEHNGMHAVSGCAAKHSIPDTLLGKTPAKAGQAGCVCSSSLP